MNTFDIQKFEQNKGKQGYNDEYHYQLADSSNVREFEDKANNPTTYQKEISKDFSPFQTYYYYYHDGSLSAAIYAFNDCIVLSIKYDKLGRVTKQTDYDKQYKHTFEQIREIVLKEKKVDIYDTRQAVALRDAPPHYSIKKYYQIHVLKSELVGGKWYSQPNYSFMIDDSTGKEWQPKETKSSDNTDSLRLRNMSNKNVQTSFLEGESGRDGSLVYIAIAVIAAVLLVTGVVYFWGK